MSSCSLSLGQKRESVISICDFVITSWESVISNHESIKRGNEFVFFF